MTTYMLPAVAFQNTDLARDRPYLKANYPHVPVKDAPADCPKNRRAILGEGWHGKVKLACHVPSGQEVVIKSQLRGALALGEVRMLRALQGPHVVRLLDEAEGASKPNGPVKHYTVLERGEPIALAGMDAPQARDIMRQIVAALRRLHACGTFHRDLVMREPTLTTHLKNVVRLAGEVKLIDLGKASRPNSTMLRGLFLSEDLRGACHQMTALLHAIDPGAGLAFRHWYRRQPDLSLDVLAAHPFLCDQNGGEAPPGSAWNLLQRPAHVVAATMTAYAHLWGERQVPTPPTS